MTLVARRHSEAYEIAHYGHDVPHSNDLGSYPTVSEFVTRKFGGCVSRFTITLLLLLALSGCTVTLNVKEPPQPVSAEAASKNCYLFILATSPPLTSMLKFQAERDYRLKTTGYLDHDGEPGTFNLQGTGYKLVQMKPGRYPLVFQATYNAAYKEAGLYTGQVDVQRTVSCAAGDIVYARAKTEHPPKMISLSVWAQPVAERLRAEIVDIAINNKTVLIDKLDAYIRSGGTESSDYLAPPPKPK
jgi:hypothetical protein